MEKDFKKIGITNKSLKMQNNKYFFDISIWSDTGNILEMVR